MSLETIKKLIWSANMFFFLEKRPPKKAFFQFYGYIAGMLLLFIVWVTALVII